MNAFIGSLGGRLAERWLALLAMPGLLYLATLTGAMVLGQRHWYDVGRLSDRLDRVATAPGAHSPGAIALVALGLLAGAAAVGTAARSLGTVTERIWLMDARGPVTDRLTERRSARWNEADARYRAALLSAGRTRMAGQDNDARAGDAERHYAARDRIALTPPRHPFWVGDRVAAPERRVWRAYRLDLVAAWPHLWLLAPDGTREELHTARLELGSAARLIAWGMGYVLLAVWWWPAAVVGVVAVVAGLNRGREAATAFADLVEAVTDLHVRELAAALGVECGGRFTREAGEELSRALGKTG